MFQSSSLWRNMPTWQYQLSYLNKDQFQIKTIKTAMPSNLSKRMPWADYERVKEQLLRTNKEVQVVPTHVLNAMNHRPKARLQDFTEKSIEVLKEACSFWDKLYEHQKVGVAKAVIEFKGCSLIADEMGAGKSYTALATAAILLSRKSDALMLILSPAFLVKQWQRYASEYLADVKVQCYSYDKAKNMHKDLKKIKWNLVLCDESHCLKDTKTKRFKKLGALIRKAKFKLLLSGTPCVNKANELFSPLNLLHPKVFKSYKKFCFRYFDLLSRRCRLPEELHIMLPVFGLIRREKKDVLDLPKKHVHWWYIVDAEARKSVAKLKKRLEEESVKDSNMSKYLIGEAFHELAEIKIKCKTFKETLTRLIQKNEKPIVLFCVHLSILEMLMQLCQDLNCKHAEISGAVSMKKRDAIVTQFQSNEIDVLCCTIAAAGVGLTLTKSHHVIIAESDWVPGNLSQAIDRVHRIGQEKEVHIDRIVFSDSLDEWILKVENGKKKMHKLLLAKKK
jgi:SWI/SNF-related matrix-associated actin-dependent regulator 1 of chromatin subfamily A